MFVWFVWLIIWLDVGGYGFKTTTVGCLLFYWNHNCGIYILENEMKIMGKQKARSCKLITTFWD